MPSCNTVVVDLVGLEGEDLGQAAADLVDQDHAANGKGTVLPGEVGGGDGHRIEVVVAELAGGVAELGAEAEVGAVGVPFPHGA